MLGKTPLEALGIRIERAERRLACQQRVLGRLRRGIPSRYAALAQDMNKTMQAQVAALRHRSHELATNEPMPSAFASDMPAAKSRIRFRKSLRRLAAVWSQIISGGRPGSTVQEPRP